MKQNIIMISILVILFVLGLLIYDFSDELGSDIANRSWYNLEDSGMTIMSFNGSDFSYIYEETGKSFGPYHVCKTFKYNHSIKVIKLDCSVKGNKLFITPVENERLVVTIDNEEKTFHKTRTDALHAKFIKDNELNQLEFEALMSYDLEIFKKASVESLQSLHRSKNNVFVAIINDDKSLQTALNIRALTNSYTTTEYSLFIVVINEKTEEELKILNGLLDVVPNNEEMMNNFHKLDNIPFYHVGNRKVAYVSTLKINNYEETEQYLNTCQ